MTRTAERLCMTQPSVSQALAELEQHYQSQLMERLGKTLRLTPQGALLLMRAKDILERLAATDDLMRGAASRRIVRLGASATVGSYLLPTILSRIQEREPELHVDVLVANTAQVEQAILSAELDLALVEGRTHSRFLRSIPVAKDWLVLVGHPRLWPGRRIRSAKILESLPFLMREPGSGTAEQAHAKLAEWGIQPRIAGVANSIDTLRVLAGAGIGLAFLPRLAVAKELAEGTLLEFQPAGTRLERVFRIIHHSGKALEGDVRLVADGIRN